MSHLWSDQYAKHPDCHQRIQRAERRPQRVLQLPKRFAQRVALFAVSQPLPLPPVFAQPARHTLTINLISQENLAAHEVRVPSHSHASHYTLPTRTYILSLSLLFTHSHTPDNQCHNRRFSQSTATAHIHMQRHNNNFKCSPCMPCTAHTHLASCRPRLTHTMHAPFITSAKISGPMNDHRVPIANEGQQLSSSSSVTVM
eukprot:m.229530 g.229530  ORF g.229530 m.229530 type:complete len:200 (-) comp54257_c0_seq54:971-1570(-)